MALTGEFAFYKAHVAEWLGAHEGEFVLIKGEDFSFYADDDAAYRAALEKFGDVDVLIKQVRDGEVVEDSPALLYGLLNAES